MQGKIWHLNAIVLMTISLNGAYAMVDQESFRVAMSMYWLLAAAANADGLTIHSGGTVGSPREGRAKVAYRLAKAVLRASAAGRSKRMTEAVAAAPDTMFPEQAAFGLRREHAFCLQLVELAELLVEQDPASRRGAVRLHTRHISTTCCKFSNAANLVMPLPAPVVRLVDVWKCCAARAWAARVQPDNAPSGAYGSNCIRRSSVA